MKVNVDGQRGLRILIIDDSTVVLSALERALTPQGHTVVTTTQTVGTARYLHNVDLVLIDYHMPGMNGRVVLESLRAACSPTKTPLFYLSTSDRDVALGARADGFDGALTDKGDIQATVRQVAQVERAIRSRRR